MAPYFDTATIVFNIAVTLIIFITFMVIDIRLCLIYCCSGSNSKGGASAPTMARKMKVLICIMLVSYTGAVLNNLIGSIYVATRLASADADADGDGTVLVDNYSENIFSSFAGLFFAVGFFTFIYFLIYRLQFFHGPNAGVSHRLSRYLQIHFILLITFLLAVFVVGFGLIRGDAGGDPSAGVLFVYVILVICTNLLFISIIFILLFLFMRIVSQTMVSQIRQSMKLQKSERETQMQLGTGTGTGTGTIVNSAGDNRTENEIESDNSFGHSMFNLQLIHMNIKFGLLSLLPLVVLLVAVLFNAIIYAFVVDIDNQFGMSVVRRMLNVMDITNGVCIVLMLRVNKPYYAMFCHRCHVCQQRCGFWQVFHCYSKLTAEEKRAHTGIDRIQQGHSHPLTDSLTRTRK